MATPWYAVAALSISAVALVVAAKNYLRKSGLLIRGIYRITSSIDCNDTYISSVILENLKDRAVTVFAVYLRLGYNYYLEIEDLEDRPLVLKAFETHRMEYGPIQFYGSNSKRIRLDSLLKDNKVKKRLVLSTSDGKYVVPSNVRMWSPVGDYFRNHMTAIVHPVRATYKGKHIGGNARYVVEALGENGREEIIPIRARDFELRVFANFHLTPESLESQEALESYLTKQMESGNLACKSFKVIDMAPWQVDTDQSYTGKEIDARYFSAFQYYVIGRFLTRRSDRKLKQRNALHK